MKSLNVFLIEMKKSLANIKLHVFIYLLAPFLISLVYGLMYEKSFDTKRDIPKFSIAVVDQDNGLYSQNITSIFKDGSLSKAVTIKDGLNENEAKNALINGKLDVAVVIAKNFAKDIENGSKASINVIKSPSADIEGQIVSSIINTYTDNIDSLRSVYSSAYKSMGSTDAQKLIAKISPEINSIYNQNYVSIDKLQKTAMVSSKQYYALTMMIMFSLFLISVGASALIREREDGTLLRIKSTSTEKFSYITGKLMWNFVFSIIVISTFIILTWAINKISWGKNPVQIIIMILVHSFLISGLSVLAASLFRTQKSMSGILTIILMAMASLGGTFYPTDGFPKALKAVSHFTLNYWLQLDYSKLMLGTQLTDLSYSIILLILIGAIGLILGSIKFKFDKSEVA